MAEPTNADNAKLQKTMDEIQTAFRPFIMLAAGIPLKNVEAALSSVDRADSFGWVVNPTAYRQALEDKRLERQRDLITLFLSTRKKLLELFPKDEELLAATVDV